jgi:hypothetical protein
MGVLIGARGGIRTHMSRRTGAFKAPPYPHSGTRASLRIDAAESRGRNSVFQELPDAVRVVELVLLRAARQLVDGLGRVWPE